MDDVLILIAQTQTQDARGVWQSTPSSRQVFCKVSSVSRTEFFDGGRNGLNPEYRFTVFHGDYNGERVCRYRDNAYAIYRTYIVPGTDYIELYAERQGGTNGTAAN